jgi:hypothetical protein
MLVAMHLGEPYRPRPILPLGIEAASGWRLKVYGIAYERASPRSDLVAAAKTAAFELLPQPAETETRYGVGFLGIHDGRGHNFVFVDWWEQENELHHHVFFSPSDRPAELRPAADGDPAACVWDLSVVSHEREAWIRHVLDNEIEPDLDAYLADALTGRF